MLGRLLGWYTILVVRQRINVINVHRNSVSSVFLAIKLATTASVRVKFARGARRVTARY